MHDLMMPETIKYTRKVEFLIYCNVVAGFKFYDGNNTLIFEVGGALHHSTVAVLICADEQIIGFKAKFAGNTQA
jgi:hypothetical protein